MSDWQAGDLALCISDENAEEVIVGRTYRVCRVIPNGRLKNGKRDIGLAFSDCQHGPQYSGFWSGLFTKIRPDEREACAPEFVTLLQRIKRKEVA